MPEMRTALRADVDWLRKEAGHVDVENNFDDDGSMAGDGLRGIANRIEDLQQQYATLLANLAVLATELRALPVIAGSSGNGYVEHFVLQADVWRLAERFDSELAKHRGLIA